MYNSKRVSWDSVLVQDSVLDRQPEDGLSWFSAVCCGFVCVDVNGSDPRLTLSAK